MRPIGEGTCTAIKTIMKKGTSYSWGSELSPTYHLQQIYERGLDSPSGLLKEKIEIFSALQMEVQFQAFSGQLQYLMDAAAQTEMSQPVPGLCYCTYAVTVGFTGLIGGKNSIPVF